MDHPEERTNTAFYDVIIVGSGPAGGSAAYFLGEGGKRVLVLEKEHLPRYKTCGGGVSLRFLHKQFPFSFEPVIQNRVTGLTFMFAGLEASIPLAPDALGLVMRADFDACLLSHTRAEVVEGAAVRRVSEFDDRVEVETQDGRIFAAAYLIGADGANSVVAHALGLRRSRLLAAGIEAEVPVGPDVKRRFEQQMVFLFDKPRYGYLWIFSKADHLSVGIAALHPKRGELQKTLVKEMARYGISLNGAALHGHPIPIYTRPERVATRRCLLVGDAAGLVDPLSGEGIRFAIKSGRLAAEAILSGRPERYPGTLYWAIGLNHSVTFLIGLAFYAFALPCLLFGAPNPFAAQGIVDLISDQISTFTFVLYCISTLPIFLGTEITAGLLHLAGRLDLSDRLRALIYPEAAKAAYRGW